MTFGILAVQTNAAPPAAPMTHSQASFKVWKQGFEHDTAGWMTQEDPGVYGWCGSIERVDRRTGELEPSAGRAYALLEHGGCNDLYDDLFPEGSAPASSDPNLLNDSFPQAGFSHQLDVYLDPEWAEGTSFGYAVSFQVLDESFPNFRYFVLPVTKEDGTLLVSGHEVTEADWYTFRYIYSSSGGKLLAEFQLVRDGSVLYSEPISHTQFSGEAVSDFDASNVSNGYIWFVFISNGNQIAIDEHLIRPGS